MSGPGNGGGNDFGGGGGGLPSFDCAKVSIKTNVISPDPTVLSTLVAGNLLDISLSTATGPLIAVTRSGNVLGAVFTKDPASLISCINGGYVYKATILSISGGDVQILITNR